MSGIGAAQTTLIAKASELTGAGRTVRLIRTMLVPRKCRCMSFYECADPAVVRRLHEESGLPIDKIWEMFDLSTSKELDNVI